MLNAVIRLSLRHRGLVLLAGGLLLIVGSLWTARLPLDVFPDVSAPSVTVVTEARGLAPEEVELLVTFPLESVINGAPGVRRVRSVSAAGHSPRSSTSSRATASASRSCSKNPRTSSRCRYAPA